MLVEFRVKNFLSFKDEAIFSMLTSGDKEHPENLKKLIPFDEAKGEYLTKVALLYGANASGKTNLLSAIYFLCSGVLISKNRSTSEDTPVEPFLFDDNTPEQPSKFEIRFIQKNIMYIYGIELNSHKILKEYLYKSPEGRFNARPTKIFERTDNEEENLNINVSKLKKKYIIESAHNRLYLSVAGFWADPDVVDAYKWFEENIQIFIPDALYKEDFKDYTKRRLIKDNGFGNKIIDLFGALNTGISSLELQKVAFDKVNFPEETPKDLKEKILKQLDEKSSILVTYHEIEGREYFLPLNRESLGTRKSLDLIGVLFDLIEKQGVLVMDELESSLHPELTKELLKYIQKSDCKIQLIFTTHDTTLMDLNFFRKEQYWFTAKDPKKQYSELFSLADIQGVRSTENIQKKYMSGRYGAFPYIKEFDKLLCQ